MARPVRVQTGSQLFFDGETWVVKGFNDGDVVLRCKRDHRIAQLNLATIREYSDFKNRRYRE
jgi:hypothetical protein